MYSCGCKLEYAAHFQYWITVIFIWTIYLTFCPGFMTRFFELKPLLLAIVQVRSAERSLSRIVSMVSIRIHVITIMLEFVIRPCYCYRTISACIVDNLFCFLATVYYSFFWIKTYTSRDSRWYGCITSSEYKTNYWQQKGDMY